MRSLALFSLLLLPAMAHAECFEFTGQRPASVGFAQLALPADRICVRPGHGQFATVNFELYPTDSRYRDLVGKFNIVSSVQGRCIGFCRTFNLGSGEANGVVVSAAGASVDFMVESNTGTVSIYSPSTGSVQYSVQKTYESAGRERLVKRP